MNIIGIDLGTTGICGVKLSNDGTLLESKTVNSDAFIPSSLEYEKIQSPEKIISIATEILDALIDEDTAAIGVTGQMHGILYLDKNGKCISPLYTWQDERGNLPYKSTTYAKHLQSFAGYGNVTDFFNRENGIRKREAVSYTTVHDYFVMTLTNEKTPLMHASNGASLGNFDILTNTFSYDIDVKVTGDYVIRGTYKGIPVSIAIGDNQASVFSTLKDEKGILINVGTGSQVSSISERLISIKGIEARPYFDNKFLYVGAALCGGRAYSILKNFYKQLFSYVAVLDDDQVYSIMGKLLFEEAAPLLVDTRFQGTRSDPLIAGRIEGITESTFNPASLTKGVLEGMVTELYCMYEQMNISAESMVVSGNGIRKNLYLLKCFEERFKLSARIPLYNEEAAIGAALYAGIAQGTYKSASEAQAIIRYQ